MSTPALMALALITASIGTLGGLGGAVLLVPALVLLGTEPSVAAPLGLISVAAGSLSAAPKQLASGLVHQRLGITMELTATGGAIAAALVSTQISGGVLQLVLAATAAAAGFAGLTRSEVRNLPEVAFTAEPSSEWPGTLDGAYAALGGVIPYRARNVGPGLLAMAVAGVVTGLAGVGGGFIKTPAMRELMYIPVKVAASTTTFTVSITSATALVVFASQGRIDVVGGSAVALGGLMGGILGSRLQDLMSPATLRRALAVILIAIAAILVVEV